MEKVCYTNIVGFVQVREIWQKVFQDSQRKSWEIKGNFLLFLKSGKIQKKSQKKDYFLVVLIYFQFKLL